jgi:N-acetylmuramoyl-L-alanine amidase
VKKYLITFIAALSLLIATGVSASAVSLEVDSKPVTISMSVSSAVTYVPLRAVSQILCPGAAISWENNEAVVRTTNLLITAQPGSCYINANGRMLYAADGIKVENGRIMVPIRVLAKAFGASVSWDSTTGTVSLVRGSGTIQSGDSYYSSDAVYWLSRIISAESQQEPLAGKIAVGNVILNRVASSDFPNSIYGVIFDSRWGGQFQPVKNGTIYDTPTAESILAAKLCLDGASVAGSSLYFLNPAISSNFWTMQNRSYITTIGNHVFYA